MANQEEFVSKLQIDFMFVSVATRFVVLKQISHVVIHCVCASNLYKHWHDHYMNIPSIMC